MYTCVYMSIYIYTHRFRWTSLWQWIIDIPRNHSFFLVSSPSAAFSWYHQFSWIANFTCQIHPIFLNQFFCTMFFMFFMFFNGQIPIFASLPFPIHKKNITIHNYSLSFGTLEPLKPPQVSPWIFPSGATRRALGVDRP